MRPRPSITLLLGLSLLFAACSSPASTTTTSPTVPPSTSVSSSTTSTTTTTVAEATTTTALPLAEPVKDTWTLVLASIPIGAGAEGKARALAAAVPGAGILLSNDYPSLNPGYWVVFLGSSTEQDALTCPDGLDPEYSCYPRFLGIPPVAAAVALLGNDLVRLDAATGDTLATIVPFFSGDGLYRYGLSLTPDKLEAYFSENWEDSWFSCESSPGSIGRVDLVTGEIEDLWTGTGATVSPDGRFVAYLEASQCLPDPENPDFWYLTPYDRVVVVDLVFNEPAFMDSQALPTDYLDPNALDWVRFHPDGEALVGTALGAVYKVPLGAANPIQTYPQVLDLAGVEGFPVEVSGNDLIITEWVAEGFALVSYDLGTGDRTELWTTETWIEAGADESGNLIAAYEDWVHPFLGDGVRVDGIVIEIDW